jgi:peptidoglycan/LPS O-acetylase OafA/YrhL
MDRAAGWVGASVRSVNRLSVVNGLRGIAILLVLYYHLIAGTLSPSGVAIPLSPLMTNGWTGVNLFFILSGLVLFLPYAADDQPLRDLSHRLAFYRRRFLRLMPLFYFAVLVEWLLAQGPQARNFGELISVLSGTFVLNPSSFGPSFNTPLWSIGVEIAFSLMFPVLVLGMRRLGPARFAALILALALLARIAGILRLPAVQGPSFNSDTVICRIDEFVLGMVLAQLYIDRRLPSRPGWCALVGLALVVLAWIGFDMVLRGALPPITRAILNDGLDAGLCAIVLASLVPQTRLAAVLAWSPLQVVGMMCYSLYIWHLPLLLWLAPDRAVMSMVTLALVIPLFLTLVFVVAAFSYRFIEFPRVREWRRLFLLEPSHRVAKQASP